MTKEIIFQSPGLTKAWDNLKAGDHLYYFDTANDYAKKYHLDLSKDGPIGRDDNPDLIYEVEDILYCIGDDTIAAILGKGSDKLLVVLTKTLPFLLIQGKDQKKIPLEQHGKEGVYGIKKLYPGYRLEAVVVNPGVKTLEKLGVLKSIVKQAVSAKDLLKEKGMELLQKRIEKIKQALKKKDLKQGASLLIATLASDDMFSYWSSCCQGSERVPKILKYIREISFDEALPTASIDLVKGRLKLGVGFFLDQIQAPEDFLFILIHERNHLILTKLYPDLNPGNGYPLDLFNFAQDAYINAIGRRNIVSTLPERFYKDPLEMVLTGRHSRIDWSGYRIKGDSDLVKEAHQGIYRGNYSLMEALGERLEGVGIPGYRQWMEIMAEWYQESRSQAQPGPDKPDFDTECEESGQAPSQIGPQTDRESCDPTSSDEETDDGGGEEGPDQEEAGGQEEEEETGQAREPRPQEEGPGEEAGLEEETPPFAWKPEPGRLKVLLNLIPPWWTNPRISGNH